MPPPIAWRLYHCEVSVCAVPPRLAPREPFTACLPLLAVTFTWWIRVERLCGSTRICTFLVHALSSCTPRIRLAAQTCQAGCRPCVSQSPTL